MASNSKSGLGRGLNTLMGGDTYKEHQKDNSFKDNIKNDDITTFDGEVKIRKIKKKSTNDILGSKKQNTTYEIPIDLIITNPNQPRKKFNEKELEELTDSIKRNGLIQPLVVTKNNDKYEIIAGERRYRACKLAKFKTIPSIVRETPDEKKMEIALIENIQREDLNPMEEAICYQKILKTQDISHAELAEILSKGRSTITNSLRLLELPENAQKYLFDNKISAGHARAILSVPTEIGKNNLADKIVKENLSVRETENIANSLKNQTKALKTVRPEEPKSFKRAKILLQDYLKTKVSVKKSQKNNKIQITFNDNNDLERILNLIVK